LEVKILLDLLHQFFIRDTLAAFDDQCAQRHSKSFGRCSKSIAKLCCVVIFKPIQGYELGALDLTIVTRKSSAKWPEEIFKRVLMAMLASIHVENIGRCFGRNRPI